LSPVNRSHRRLTHPLARRRVIRTPWRSNPASTCGSLPHWAIFTTTSTPRPASTPAAAAHSFSLPPQPPPWVEMKAILVILLPPLVFRGRAGEGARSFHAQRIHHFQEPRSFQC